MVLPVNLTSPLHEHALVNPSAPALYCDDQVYTYMELARDVEKLAKTLGNLIHKPSPRVGVLATHSYAAYQAVLATLWTGGCYVPLVATHPVRHLRRLIEQSDIDAIVVDQTGFNRHRDLVGSSAIPVLDLSEPAHADPDSEYIPAPPASVSTEDTAYIMFTSGTTGIPKGCAPTHTQVTSFIKAMQSRYGFTAGDRFAQYCNLAFDASVFVLFSALNIGAKLCVIPAQYRLSPLKFLKRERISVVYLMPSLVSLLQRSGQIREVSLSELKHTFFGAESLTVKTATRWQDVSPNGNVHNFYGPTEVTVSCTAHRFDRNKAYVSGEVPIGVPLPGIYMGVIDKASSLVNPGVSGELVVSGEQVLKQYWHDSDATKKAFVEIEHPVLGMSVWYRTGDWGYCDDNGQYHLSGRHDEQVKIRGTRIELSYLRRAIRQVAEVEEVVILPWHKVDGVFLELVAFIESDIADTSHLFSALRKDIPEASMPTRIHAIEKWPQLPSGKIDIGELQGLLNASD